MAEQMISAPSSSAGLVRFTDVTASKVHVSPELVMGASVAFIALEIVAHIIT